MPDSPSRRKTVAILGGGPVGLAAAAHLLERGMEPVVLEAVPAAGHAVRQWSHVSLFSPWEYAVDKSAELLLATVGRRSVSVKCRTASPMACPTCWAASVRAMPARRPRSWGPATRPSAP